MKDTCSEVRTICFTLLLCIALSGCFSQKNVPVDPCAKAPKLCWGPNGVTPEQVPACKQLFQCYDWEVRKKD